MTEIWKDIPGWEGVYKASNFGRIKSLKRVVTANRFNKKIHQLIEEKILTGSIKKSGYLSVTLSKNGKTKTCLIHRLVLSSFVKNKFKKQCINHIDFNKLNNSVSNLEWVSHKENILHTHKNKRNADFRGSNSHFAKLDEEDVFIIREMFNKKINRNEIAKKFGIHRQTVYSVANKKSWSNI